MPDIFTIKAPKMFEPRHGGLFISPGKWIHSKRIIDSYELIFVREGIVKMFENDKKFEIHPGEMLTLFPRKEHGGTIEYEGKLSFYWLHFTLGQDINNEFSQELKIPQHAKPVDSHRLGILFRQYLNEWNKELFVPLRAELIIMQILCEASLASQQVEGANLIAEQVFRFIAEHFAEPISTASIAHELKRNPDYIGRCFKSAYKYTITDEINRRRLREAEKLLIDKDMNLNEIAAECGFNDAGYFRKLFARKNGISPGKYRKRLSRIHINTQ